MTTGAFESWSGHVADLGPLYPFVGWEWFFIIVSIVIWIGWHILTIREEEKEIKEHEEAHGDRDSLTQIMAREALITEKQARREMV